MRLTESQIRSIISSELKEAKGLERLDEFKAIFGALVGIFKALGGLLSTNFAAAAKSYDKSGFKTSYDNKSDGKSEKSLSPKTDPYDQVYMLGQVLWHVDAAIELSITSMDNAITDLNSLEFPVEPDDTSFSDILNSATENISRSAGHFGGYLSKAPSSKISGIGANLEPGEMPTEALKNLAAAVSELESVDPISDWEKISKSEAVTNVVDGESENAEALKNLINEINGSYIKNIDRLDELKTKIDEANTIAVQAEQVMDVAAEEEGAKPEDSDLLDHRIRKLRVLIGASLE